MRLVKLSCDCLVNPSEVAEIVVSSGSITVRMRSGVGHHVDPNYREGVYAAVDRIAREIQEASRGDVPS